MFQRRRIAKFEHLIRQRHKDEWSLEWFRGAASLYDKWLEMMAFISILSQDRHVRRITEFQFSQRLTRGTEIKKIAPLAAPLAAHQPLLIRLHNDEKKLMEVAMLRPLDSPAGCLGAQ
jgi:hypothetical protein